MLDNISSKESISNGNNVSRIATKLALVASCVLVLGACSATKKAWDSTTKATGSAWDATSKATSDLLTFDSDNTPRSDLKAIWSRSVGYQSDFLQVAVYGDVIYVVNENARVYGYELSTGERVASYKVKKTEDIVAGLGVSDDSLLMVDDNGFIFSIDRNNGGLQWKKSLNVEVLVPPVAKDNSVFVHGINGSLFSLNGLTGDVLWKYDHKQPGLTLRGGSKPLIVDDKIVSGFADGSLVANDINAGYVVWELALGNRIASDDIQQISDIDTQPLLENGILYASSFQGRTVALDISLGSVLWEAPANTYKPFTLTQNHMFVIVKENELVALDKQTGKEVWNKVYTEEELEHIDAVFQINNNAYFINNEGVAYEFDKSNGSIISKKSISDDDGITQPINVGNNLIILSRDGKLSVY